MTTYKASGVDIKLYAFPASASDGEERLSSQSRHSTPGEKRHCYPLGRMSGPQSWSRHGRKEKHPYL